MSIIFLHHAEAEADLIIIITKSTDGGVRNFRFQVCMSNIGVMRSASVVSRLVCNELLIRSPSSVTSQAAVQDGREGGGACLCQAR